MVTFEAADGTRLACHQAGSRIGWHASTHERSGLACGDCHRIHQDRDPVLVKSSEPDVCFACHRQKRGDFQKPSTHPVRFGLMSCSDCHSPHGSTTVCLLSGGNNDVSRYADIVERALVWEGRKHYFLVEFPQEPGALRRFLDDILGPDDITLFEYVKRSNRETGPALVGIELGDPADLEPLLERMESAPPRIERIPPDSPLFRFIL